MPKVRRARSSSLDQSRKFPYPCSSNNAEQCIAENPFQQVGDEKEWEDARCPICMEHPHNAILLLCSSHDKGCRPYMCNTSYRHSNCLDQFCNSFATTPSTALSGEVPLSSTASHRGREGGQQGSGERLLVQLTRFSGKAQPKLLCPLCRGHINGSVVIEPARRFMNSKHRSCSLETCDFSGTYSVLRRHARLEHPSVRPSEVDPRRQHEWTRLERERDFQDAFNAYQLDSGDEGNEGNILLELWDSEDYIRTINAEWEDNLVNVEQLMDFENFFSTIHSESEEERNDGSLLCADFDFELPFSFLDEFFPFAPLLETSESGDRRGSRPSLERRSAIRSRQTYPMEVNTTRLHGNMSSGHAWGLRRQRSRQNN
ncbi:uncharacterized protein LOC132283538 [Cornus florida]|uniref:uncharacterized protein LOC132283538 n=1 Tax=Cornus florida TaxID=4283 RepID=UPI00289A0A61|nr:uncharacterized protein LOC132283538 [Cornus florida]